MAKIKVPDMKCEKCSARISKALEEAGLTFKMLLGEKAVEIEGDEAAVESAMEELYDLGFTPEK